jgi:hypothetical protein
VTGPKRKAASRPAARTVEVHGTGEFAEWEGTAKADFPASVLADLQSESIERIMQALDVIVIDHNFPDADGDVAEVMADVDPYDGLLMISGQIFEAIGKLPNR